MPTAGCAGTYSLWHADLGSVWPDATLCSSVMGVLAGALQGYYGGKSISGGNALLKYGRGCRRCFDYFTFQRRTA